MSLGTAQYHGHVSCVFWSDCGAVGEVPQAAATPSKETARTRRTTSWRDMHALREEGERDVCHQTVWWPVTGRYLDSLQVT